MSGNTPTSPPANVLQRLQHSTRAARRAGFTIRAEWLDGETTGWCEFGGSRWIFVDLSLPVIEQIAQIEEALANYRRHRNPSPEKGVRHLFSSIGTERLRRGR